MDEDRINYFRSLDVKAVEDLRAYDFTKSEILELINDTCMNQTNYNIACDYFINKLNYKQIADKYFFDERTVKTKLGEISTQLILTCRKKFYNIRK